jgi:hypothetical protein
MPEIASDGIQVTDVTDDSTRIAASPLLVVSTTLDRNEPAV